MKTGKYTVAASALALGLATMLVPHNAQGQPLFDRVNVDLPYAVTIGKTTLQPGNYVIQQQRSFSGDNTVLLIYGDNGMKFETSALTIPALENRTQPNTRVILHHLGSDYYFDKVWVQGKDYGYEFPLPDNVKGREKEMMQPVSVAAQYSTTPTAPPAQAEPTPPPAATQPEPTPPPVAAVPEPTPPPVATQPEPAPQPPPDTSANRAVPETMPHTSAGWLMMLLSGGALSGLGISLRRKQ
jgi:hypothetical protein